MSDWKSALSLDFAAQQPLSVQLAQAIVAEIRRGRLRPGMTLPGTRTMANSLKISRNTVDTAYQELKAEGWITMLVGRGTLVSNDLPDPHPSVKGVGTAWASNPGFTMPTVGGDSQLKTIDPRTTGQIAVLWDYGVPDVRLALVKELVRALRRALCHRTKATLQYDRYDPETPSALQRALASMLSATRGLPVRPNDLLVTYGSQMALYLIARVLLQPGDVVAVEHPGYLGAWDVLRQVGAQIVPIPVDDAGIRVNDLKQLVAQKPIRAVFVTPHHQFPTTMTLAAGRRLELLRLAQQSSFAIIEDDYDHELHFEGRPVLPLASMDTAGVVLYIGTLSKIFAPGLRLGYLAAPTEFLQRARVLRTVIDLQSNRATEMAVAELFEEGDIQRHWRRSLRIYRRRRDHLVSLLRRRLAGVLDFDTPAGGMAIWARVTAGVDVQEWAKRAQARGLFFRTGSIFFLDGQPRSFVRLGYARFDEQEQKEAVDRMVASLPRWSRSKPARVREE